MSVTHRIEEENDVLEAEAESRLSKWIYSYASGVGVCLANSFRIPDHELVVCFKIKLVLKYFREELC